MTNPVGSDDPSRCMKCGFCMSVCPVYQQVLSEGHVARGRNMLIKAVREDGMEAEEPYRDVLSSCLLCKRCGSVCPARLTPDQITLNARNQLVDALGLTWFQQWVNRALLSHRDGLARMAGLAGLLPGLASNGRKPLRHLADMARIFSGSLSFPVLSSPRLRKQVNPVTPPSKGQSPRERIAVFPGCVFEYFQAPAAKDLIDVLSDQGYDVVYPEGLTCCGQAVHSAGDFNTARELARRNLEILGPFDTIVTGCATCSSALKGYGQWFGTGDPWQEKAQEFSSKVMDFSHFLVSRGESLNLEGAEETSSVGLMTVTYHDPCHLRQHQGVFEEPRKILRALPGIRFIDMENADACCGLGGSFGISHPEVSSAILRKKIQSIEKTGAEAVVTSCPGCMLYLSHGLRKENLSVKVLHIAQVMARCL